MSVTLHSVFYPRPLSLNERILSLHNLIARCERYISEAVTRKAAWNQERSSLRNIMKIGLLTSGEKDYLNTLNKDIPAIQKRITASQANLRGLQARLSHLVSLQSPASEQGCVAQLTT